MILKIIAILASGVMSYASPGVLERVATNRAAGITAYDVPANWQVYDVLLATESCRYVGSPGVLYLEDGRTLSAMVVDCQSDEHRRQASLSSLGLLADANREDVVHQHAVLVIVTELTTSESPLQVRKMKGEQHE